MQFPKLVCSGIPSAFKLDDWDDKISGIRSFGEFAQTILSNQSKIPTAVQTMIDKCINNQLNSENDLPTFDEILSILSNKDNYLNNVEEATISKYIMWLDFQDKFPCDYFFELGQTQCKSLFDAIKHPDITYEYDIDFFVNFSLTLFHGLNGFPKDIFGAFYFTRANKQTICIIKTFWKYYGCPNWLKDSIRFINLKFHRATNKEIMFDPNCSFHVNFENRTKISSTENVDIQFVIDSYLQGANSFPKSKQAAFYHVKKLLLKENKNPFLLIQLGQMYENGIGIPTNYKKAIHCFEIALNSEPKAKQHLVRAHLKQEDLEGKISNLNEECKEKMERADSNDFKEIMYVAFSFLHGLNGFPSSQYHAYQYYKKAAETDPYVYCMLGNLFRHGIVFSQNTQKAQKFYKLSHVKGCLRGQFYDGIMKAYNMYYFNSMIEKLNIIDHHFFDFKNQQGKTNPFNYCKMIHAIQQHFPVMISFYIEIKSKYTNNYKYKVPRRLKDTIYTKQSIKSINYVQNNENDTDCNRMLNDTEIQITLWFTLYQLKILDDNGLVMKNLKPSVSLFKDTNYYFAITSFNPYDEGTNYQYGATIQYIVYLEFKKSIPKGLKEQIEEQLSNTSIEKSLSYFENNLISNKVNKDEFESFIRKCKNFVPLDSAKILISEKTEKAEAGDKDCLQECAHNYFYGIDPFPINYRESFRFYKILSEDNYNDANAQMWLGIMLSKGIGVKQDIQEALKWFKKASEQDNIEAKLNYALFAEYYNRKIKKPKNPNIPYMDILLECTDELHLESLFKMGMLKESHYSLEYGRKQSIEYYQKASSLGHIESTRRLYHIYKKLGMNEEQKSLLPFLKTINDPKYIYIFAKKYYDEEDYENSIKYTKMMVPTKDSKILKLYADHLLYGHGIEKDVDKAKKLYIIASQGYPKAMDALANIYVDGIDCEKDLLKARKIYHDTIAKFRYESNSAGYIKFYCDFCEKHGYNTAAFNYHYINAMENSVKESQYKVGMSLINPVNKECKKNTTKGFELLALSASQHYPIAAYKLGRFYIYGEFGLKRNFDKGVQYLNLASGLDFVDATFLLGLIYHKGIGTIPDDDTADEFFTKAAEKNHPGAKYYFYLNKENEYEERHKYLMESAEQGFDKAQFKYGQKLIKKSCNDHNDEKYQTGVEYIVKAMNQQNKKAIAYYKKNIAKKK